MKLQLNRREVMKGLVFKTPWYYLDVILEVTPEEQQLIKKHKWKDAQIAKGTMASGAEIGWSIGNMIGTHEYPFKQIEYLADFERQVIESAKQLKANLEAASGFTASGPREIEL